MTLEEGYKYQAGVLCDFAIQHNAPHKEYKDGFLDGCTHTHNRFLKRACEWLLANRNKLSRVNDTGFVELFKEGMK